MLRHDLFFTEAETKLQRKIIECWDKTFFFLLELRQNFIAYSFAKQLLYETLRTMHQPVVYWPIPEILSFEKKYDEVDSGDR